MPHHPCCRSPFMSPKILLLTLPLLLAGCSSLSEEECRAMSWYNQGYQDGEQGKTRTATRDYKQTCGEYGLRVDEDEWQRGYAKGSSSIASRSSPTARGGRGTNTWGSAPTTPASSPSSSAAARSICWSSASASCNRSWSAPSGPSISWISRSGARATASSGTTTGPSASAPSVTTRGYAVTTTGSASRIG
ncbi:DUF2799 domain-containing protein [Aeromonas rivipollensis]